MYRSEPGDAVYGDGTHRDVDMPAGRAGWLPAQTHAGENMGRNRHTRQRSVRDAVGQLRVVSLADTCVNGRRCDLPHAREARRSNQCVRRAGYYSVDRFSSPSST